MGTRHLICIFWNGKWYVAQYGQFDGYPEGQGVKLFNFLSVARNIENLKAGLEKHVYHPTEEEVRAMYEECERLDRERYGFNEPYKRELLALHQRYPSLARETSAGVLGIIARAGLPEEEEEGDGAEGGVEQKKPKKIPLNLELEFANDGLFCEWAYVVDLDKEVFEVFGGSEYKHDGHRFKDVGPDDASVPALYCSFPFSELYLMKSSEEFLERAKEANDEMAKADDKEDIEVVSSDVD